MALVTQAQTSRLPPWPPLHFPPPPMRPPSLDLRSASPLFLHALADFERKQLFGSSSLRRYRTGDVIFRSGDFASALLVLA